MQICPFSVPGDGKKSASFIFRRTEDPLVLISFLESLELVRSLNSADTFREAVCSVGICNGFGVMSALTKVLLHSAVGVQSCWRLLWRVLKLVAKWSFFRYTFRMCGVLRLDVFGCSAWDWYFLAIVLFILLEASGQCVLTPGIKHWIQGTTTCTWDNARDLWPQWDTRGL